ncbi:uncharacterized protein LOC133186937 [Saccostrea echinata]|uniref:uncharacterized protein LOC133186937 n=1 Tax=Saccostrea echinata TaxID=191078 RepID=UPI002A813ED8|nr:uncharacterized protein LOC133186937 [Saccostrea echinata]
MFNLKLSKRISILEKSPKGKDEQIPLLIKETPFFKTSTFHEANSFLKDGGKILCLIGKWGSGKSTTAKNVYKSLTGRQPIVIEDILKFDVSSCQDSIIVEEPLPREDISDEEENNRVEKIIYLCKHILKTNHTFMIITSTEEAWETITDEVKKCDVDDNEYCYGDRSQIFHTIFQFYNPDKPFSIVEENVTRFQINSLGFPETCALFSKCSEFQKSKGGVLFFNRPLRYLSLYLEKMCHTSREKQKFLVLVYMSLNNMKIDMDKSNDKLWEIFRLCGLNTDSVRLKSIIPSELVVKEEPSVYVLQHEVIKRITLITFGKLYFSVLLRFSSRKDLEGWIKHKKRTFIVTELLEDGRKQASDIEPFLEINDEQWTEYQEKMGKTIQEKCENSE